MALKNYEDGMTKVGENDSSLGARSNFTLNNSTGVDTLNGITSTGKNVPVSLSDTNPVNQTALNKGEGDKNE